MGDVIYGVSFRNDWQWESRQCVECFYQYEIGFNASLRESLHDICPSCGCCDTEIALPEGDLNKVL